MLGGLAGCAPWPRQVHRQSQGQILLLGDFLLKRIKVPFALIESRALVRRRHLISLVLLRGNEILRETHIPCSSLSLSHIVLSSEVSASTVRNANDAPVLLPVNKTCRNARYRGEGKCMAVTLHQLRKHCSNDVLTGLSS